MANNLFREMQNNNMMTQFNQFQQNPMQFLTQKKINIPQQFANDPHGAVQYLLNNCQMSQQSLNRLMQVANSMGVRL